MSGTGYGANLVIRVAAAGLRRMDDKDAISATTRTCHSGAL
jgi:hypothetical protein